MQVICRIHRNATDKNFVMEMGSGGPARHPHGADDLAPADFLSHNHSEASEVAILGGKAIPMVNQSFIPIARIRPRVKENSIRCCPDNCSHRSGDVDAIVEISFS